MAQFGTTTRTAAQDANEGVVNPPAKEHAARSSVSTKTKQPDALSVGLEKVGETLGSAIQGYVDTETLNLREQQMLEGATLQGNDLAINQLAEDKKRNGIGAAFFGQNAHMRGAQQRAVSNNINKAYLDLSYTMATHADKSPEEFQGVLSERLNIMLEPFAGDKETKQMITKNWIDSAEKLAAAHYKENYGYVQAENEKENRQALRGDIDTLKFDFTQLERDANGIVMNKEYTKFQQRAENMFDPNLRAENQSLENWRKVMGEEINHALKNNDVTAYHLAQIYGFEDNLSPKEAVARNAAVGVYDTKQNQVGETMYQQTLHAINDPTKVNSKETADAHIAAYKHQIEQLEQQQSGSEAGKKNIETLKNRFLQVQRAANEAALKQEEKDLQVQAIKDGINKIWSKDDTGVTDLANIDDKALKEEVLDTMIVEEVNATLPDDEQFRTASEAWQHVLSNPELTKTVAERVQQSGIQSPAFKKAAKGFINSAWNMDEQAIGTDAGKFLPETKQHIKALTLMENTPGFTKMLGADDNIKYEMLKQAIEHDIPVEMSQRETAALLENKADREKYKQQVHDAEGKVINSRNHVARILDINGVDNPGAQALSESVLDFVDGLAIYKGDISAANAYVKRNHLNNTINYDGVRMEHKEELDALATTMVKEKNLITGEMEEREFSLSMTDFLDGMQYQDANAHDQVTLMSGIIANMYGAEGRGLTLEDVPSWDMEYDYITGGLTITVADAPMTYTLTPEEVQQYTADIHQMKFERSQRKPTPFPAGTQGTIGQPLGSSMSHYNNNKE